MKHLKGYSESRELSKIFESGITIHTSDEKLLDKYLNELGTTVEELDDIFGELIDLNYNSYLQLFYLDKNGVRYSRIPNFWLKSNDKERENHPLTPHLSILFEIDDVGEDNTIKNGIIVPGEKSTYFKKTDSIVCFTDSLSRLKSTYKEREIYWRFKPNQMEILIYFDTITKWI